MSDKIRVIQYGLGPIGSAMARHVMERKRLELVGGVDIDPAKVGKDIGGVIGLGRPLGFLVAERLAHVLARTEAASGERDSFRPPESDTVPGPGWDAWSLCQILYQAAMSRGSRPSARARTSSSSRRGSRR